MTDLQRQDWKRIVSELEAIVSLYKLAALVEYRLGRSFQYIQVDRIKRTGRCEHFVGEILLRIHSEIVPCETLQNVPRTQAMEMRTA